MFVPSQPVAETVLRGTLIYLFIFVLFRVLRRDAGAIGVQDLLVVVLVADAAQNGMAGEYKSITEGAILIATIVCWAYFINWLDYRSPWFRRLTNPPPLVLIKDGRIQRRNLRKELITEDELMQKLRAHGVEHASEVKISYLEEDGNISVIPREKNGVKGQSEKKIRA